MAKRFSRGNGGSGYPSRKNGGASHLGDNRNSGSQGAPGSRHKMGNGASQRHFTKHAGQHPANNPAEVIVMRGGIRG